MLVWAKDMAYWTCCLQLKVTLRAGTTDPSVCKLEQSQHQSSPVLQAFGKTWNNTSLPSVLERVNIGRF